MHAQEYLERAASMAHTIENAKPNVTPFMCKTLSRWLNGYEVQMTYAEYPIGIITEEMELSSRNRRRNRPTLNEQGLKVVETVINMLNATASCSVHDGYCYTHQCWVKDTPCI